MNYNYGFPPMSGGYPAPYSMSCAAPSSSGYSAQAGCPQSYGIGAPSPNHIAPAEPPRTAYVPPPKLPHRFPFDPLKRDAYANFYSILSTIEALEEEACNGVIPLTLRDELLRGLYEQYTRVANVLGFSQQRDVEEFACAADLSCSFAFATLFKNTEREKPAQTANRGALFFGIGSDLTDLSDLCEHAGATYGQCQQKALEARTKFRKLGGGCDGALQILGRWIDFFMSRRTSDALSPEERRALAADVAAIRAIVASASG